MVDGIPFDFVFTIRLYIYVYVYKIYVFPTTFTPILCRDAHKIR